MERWLEAELSFCHRNKILKLLIYVLFRFKLVLFAECLCEHSRLELQVLLL